MKPSERRALDAERKAQREAEAREEISFKNKSVNYNTYNDDVPTRESFWSKNVRIITFAICAVLILTVLGPWGIDKAVAKHRESIFGTSTKNGKDISVSDIISIASLGDTLTWKDFEKFNYTDLSYEYRDEVTKKEKTEYQREYTVDGSLTVKVIGSSLSGSPASVQLIYYGKDAEVMQEMRGADVREFLTRHGYLK